MPVAEKLQRAQRDAMPREDLTQYAGRWVALREGRVVASDLDAVVLRDHPDVRSTDALIPVPLPGPAVLIL